MQITDLKENMSLYISEIILGYFIAQIGSYTDINKSSMFHKIFDMIEHVLSRWIGKKYPIS